MAPALAAGAMSSACATCDGLAAEGVTTEERQCEPAGADALEVFGPGEGHHGSWQLRRCRTCGTLYRYRYHYEYDVAGSWDEFYFWRLEDAAQAPVRAMLDAAPGGRDAALEAALAHPSAHAREAAALVAWIWIGEGAPLAPGSIAALARALGDAEYLVGMFGYRALLTFLSRGAAEARAAADAMAAEAAGETRFRPILAREAAKLLA